MLIDLLLLSFYFIPDSVLSVVLLSPSIPLVTPQIEVLHFDSLKDFQFALHFWRDQDPGPLPPGPWPTEQQALLKLVRLQTAGQYYNFFRSTPGGLTCY